MRLVSKVIEPIRHFWVEDYSSLDKASFEGIGFKEVAARGPVEFGGKPTLEFSGSDMFGSMSDDEFTDIANSMSSYYGIDDFDVEQYIPD